MWSAHCQKWYEIAIYQVDKLDIVKEGQTITIFNALAKIENKFLRIDLDKWANVKASETVLSFSITKSRMLRQ